MSEASKSMNAAEDGFVSSPPVTIIAGKDPCTKTFYVHRQRLIDTSEYFKTALNSNFPEAESLILRLEEDDPQAMWMFTMSRYTSLSDLFDQLWDDDDFELPMSECLLLHAKAFVLGTKLMAPKFKKNLISSLSSYFSRSPGDAISMPDLLEAAKIVYDGTSTDDGWQMRKMVALYCVTRLGFDARNRQDPRRPVARPWSSHDREVLATSGLTEFIADVLREATRTKLPEKAELMGLLYPNGA